MIKRTAVLIAKLSVSATLFYLLVSRIGGRTIIYNLTLLNPFAFLGATGLYIITAYLSTLRWKLLIPFHNKTSRLFSIYMIGSFFNTYMPGTVGGDAVKAYYLNKELHAPRISTAEDQKEVTNSLAVAIASVFMDRYVGLSALLTLGMLAFPFGIRYLEKASVHWPVIWLVPAVAGVFVATTFVIFRFRFGERVKFLLKASEYFQFYRSKRKVLACGFIYSIMVQLLVILSVFILSQGLSMHIPFLSLLIFMPIIILVSSLPISISGIGLREGTFIFLLGSTGISADKSITLSVVWFMSVFVAGVWGLFEYLRFKTMFGGKEKQETLQVP